MTATLPSALLTYRNIPTGHTDPLSLPLGQNPGTATIVSWSPLRDPHMIVAGGPGTGNREPGTGNREPGTGKSSFQRTLLVMALLKGWRAWILEPFSESRYFADWPGAAR